MGHPPREDVPGTTFHLTARGVARRTIVEGDDDARGLLSLVAWSVHDGAIEVESLCIMPNHAHLMVTSLRGTLGDAMRDIESVYARRFNRRRERNGHLVQARFHSKPVRSNRYREVLIRYIDMNPVEAGIVADPADYPYGSARLYARASGPPWLARERIEEFVRRSTPNGVYSAAAYAAVFGGRPAPATRRWIAQLMSSSRADDASLDELLAASPEHIVAWMNERARAADGTEHRIPIVDAATIVIEIRAAQRAAGETSIRLRRKVRPMWRLLAVGMLRDLAGQSFVQIGVRLDLPARTAGALYGEHRIAMRQRADYREVAAECARRAIDACHPRRMLPAGV